MRTESTNTRYDHNGVAHADPPAVARGIEKMLEERAAEDRIIAEHAERQREEDAIEGRAAALVFAAAHHTDGCSMDDAAECAIQILRMVAPPPAVGQREEDARWCANKADRMEKALVFDRENVARYRRLAAYARATPSGGEPVQGVCFLLVKGGAVLMEKCPRKAQRHGGEWFIPGGRIERGEAPDEAAAREMREELGVCPDDWRELPLVDATGGDNDGSFLMRPYLLTSWNGTVPPHCLDHPDTPLRWVPLEEARRSPVRAVRAMLALLEPSGEPEAPEPGLFASIVEQALIDHACGAPIGVSVRAIVAAAPSAAPALPGLVGRLEAIAAALDDGEWIASAATVREAIRALTPEAHG